MRTAYMDPHIPETYHQRSQRGQRRGEPHPEERCRVNLTEQPRQGNTEQEGSYQAMYHGKQRIALPAEIGVDAEHEGDHNTCQRIR